MKNPLYLCNVVNHEPLNKPISEMERIIKGNSLFEIESILDNTVASLANYELTDELLGKLDSKEITIEQIDVKKLHRIAKNVSFQEQNASEYLKRMFGILDSEKQTKFSENYVHLDNIVQLSNNVILNLSQFKLKGITKLKIIEDMREIKRLSLNIQQSI